MRVTTHGGATRVTTTCLRAVATTTCAMVLPMRRTSVGTWHFDIPGVPNSGFSSISLRRSRRSSENGMAAIDLAKGRKTSQTLKVQFALFDWLILEPTFGGNVNA